MAPARPSAASPRWHAARRIWLEMISRIGRVLFAGGTHPFALSLSKDGCVGHKGFDRLSPSGVGSGARSGVGGDRLSPPAPFALSLSKDGCVGHKGFDRLSP